MDKQTFHALMVDPATPARLDAMIADNLRVDHEQAAAPGRRDCCADFAFVIACDNETDIWECPFCGHTWCAPCR